MAECTHVWVLHDRVWNEKSNARHEYVVDFNGGDLVGFWRLTWYCRHCRAVETEQREESFSYEPVRQAPFSWPDEPTGVMGWIWNQMTLGEGSSDSPL